jgi:hypothetical protein
LPPIVPIHSSAYRYLFVPDEVAVTLKAARVYRLGITGKNIVVDMIDTGFFHHPFYGWHGYRGRGFLPQALSIKTRIVMDMALAKQQIFSPAFLIADYSL